MKQNNVSDCKVTKRDGTLTTFDTSKIVLAILNANNDVTKENRISEDKAQALATEIEYDCRKSKEVINVEEIQDLVVLKLMQKKYYQLAVEYTTYRYKRALLRKANSTDETILRLVKNTDEELKGENSNKNTALASTERDYIAGEVSRDLTFRLLLPQKIAKAHKEGILHFHDADYYIQPIHNCCLINIKDMLDNGTVMNGKMIESPKSFQVACTVMTQIIASVASNQYGGQSVNVKHLGKYVARSRKKILDKKIRRFNELGIECTPKQLNELVEKELHDEIAAGVQTVQYQINTLMTTNGQSPFVTLFLEIDESDEYVEDTALVIEEILRQRITGVKNEKGVVVTPAFPKLVYLLDEHNALKGGKYDYLTKLAVECSAKRMYPDYISAKLMREQYQGNVFSPMGCRSFLSPWKDENGNFKFEGRFNQGVVSLNLPQIGIVSKGNEEKFWQILEERLSLCFEALMCRHKALEGTTSSISPIHWQHGALARLKKGEKIDKLLHNGYSTLSLGYIGLYEVTKLVTGKSHTTEEGSAFAMKVLQRLRDACDSWKKSTGIGFALYGTPAESLCYRFAKIDKQKYGSIPDVTDKGYYTNSYHVDVREKIDAFSKFTFEAKFQKLSSGGAISYVEIPNMMNNLDAMEELVKFIYDNIQYAEFNTKSDYCHVCGYNGEIVVNDKGKWECPQCHNTNQEELTVTRRTCGYLGENFWNVGKTKEISMRKLHL